MENSCMSVCLTLSIYNKVYIFNEYKKILLFPYQSTVTYLPLTTYFNSKLIFVLINTEINVANKLQRKQADHPRKLPSLHFLYFLMAELPLHHFQLETLALSFSFMWKYTTKYLCFDYHLS